MFRKNTYETDKNKVEKKLKKKERRPFPKEGPSLRTLKFFLFQIRKKNLKI